MLVEKVFCYKITCPSCGTIVTLSRDEYHKYLEVTEEYGNKIVCTEKEDNNKSHEVEYYNLSCPSCSHYIPVTLSDFDAGIYGYKCSPATKVFYGPSEEISIDDYLKRDSF